MLELMLYVSPTSQVRHVNTRRRDDKIFSSPISPLTPLYVSARSFAIARRRVLPVTYEVFYHDRSSLIRSTLAVSVFFALSSRFGIWNRF